MPPIDLRSDTVTRPSAAMRRAMADAEVGDDVFLEDPTLNLLQERAAAVVRTRSGALRAVGIDGQPDVRDGADTAGTGSRLRDQRPHLQLRDGRALCARRCAAARGQRRRWRADVERDRAGDPPEGVLPPSDLAHLSREHGEHGGRDGVSARPIVEEICDRAHEQDIHVHLDGARVFNAVDLSERAACRP